MDNKSQNLDFNFQLNQNTTQQDQIQPKAKSDEKIEVKPQNQPPNEEISATNFLYHANHPVVCFFTLFFKFVCIFSFIILSFFNKNAYIYLIIIMFAAFDFWVVKNVSGRLLVGLRWWNEVKPNGEEVWIYESKHEIKNEGVDKKVFWYSLYGNMGIWGLLCIWQILKIEFTWFVVSGVCAVFAQINLYAYLNCSKGKFHIIKEQQSTISNLAVSTVVKVVEKGAASVNS